MEIYGMTGERLGTIGGEDSHPTPGEPEWKKALLSRPSISIRKGIAWGYGSPYEDTSTVVLTSSSGLFVDVRFSLSTKPMSDPAFWAFAGTSYTTFAESPSPSSSADVSMPCMAHSKFEHIIDSKGPGIVDEGDMFLLANGDCIEVGQMANPAGKVEMYKEYWTGDTGPKTPCIVASYGNLGRIIRIGNYCQGIFQVLSSSGTPQNQVIVERWIRVPEPGSSVDEASWVKDWRCNTDADEQVEVVLPCMWACGDAREVGEEIVAKGNTWRVTEVVK